MAYVDSFNGVLEESPEHDAVEGLRERVVEAQAPLVARMVELRPVTFAGHVARARSLALWEGDFPSGDVESQYVNERLLGAILRDLLAGNAV